jgi:hypothetical protein
MDLIFNGNLEERIKVMLARVLNSEMKCFILGYCTPAEDEVRISPYSKCRGLLGDKITRNFYSLVQSYFNYSFVPSGLATKDKVLTEIGKFYARPLCHLCLESSFSNSIPLNSLFGCQNSRTSVPPYSRFKIIEEVENGMEKKEIIKKTNLNQTTVWEHLSALHEGGILNYVSEKGSLSGEGMYRWVEEEILEDFIPLRSFTKLSPRVARLCFKNKNITKSGISKSLGYSEPMYGHIQKILMDLKKQGKIEVAGFGGACHSKITFNGKTKFAKLLCRRIRNCLEDNVSGQHSMDLLQSKRDYLASQPYLFRDLAYEVLDMYKNKLIA